LGLQLQRGGKSHLRLNKSETPIANKYREGKMKRTLKRESKACEIAVREPFEQPVQPFWLGISLPDPDLT